MKLGKETGSLVNHVMTSSMHAEPKVGDGATLCGWSDRYAGTIIAVSETEIQVREDRAIRTDNNGLSECQSYRYEPNPKGAVHVFRRNKKGEWKSKIGFGLMVGGRNAYHDFSF